MIKFVIRNITYGEINESDFRYKTPGTAKRAALRFLEEDRRAGEIRGEEQIEFRLYHRDVESPITTLKTIYGAPLTNNSLITWLRLS